MIKYASHYYPGDSWHIKLDEIFFLFHFSFWFICPKEFYITKFNFICTLVLKTLSDDSVRKDYFPSELLKMSFKYESLMIWLTVNRD